jgi:hypothetical protein
MTAAPSDWPFLMPGAGDPDLDPTGGRGHAAALLDGVSKATVPLSEEFRSGDLPDGVRRVARDAIDAIGEVRQHVHRAAGNLDSHAANDLLPDKARRRLIAETKGLAAQALREVDSRSDLSLTLLEAGLIDAARPSVPAGADRGEAREELKMILDASDDPAGRIRQLAAGSDQRLAALAAGSYGASYLRAHAVPEDVIRSTAVFAAQAGIHSGDPRREAAGRALTRMDDLRKLRTQALAAASFAIGWGD